MCVGGLCGTCNFEYYSTLETQKIAIQQRQQFLCNVENENHITNLSSCVYHAIDHMMH